MLPSFQPARDQIDHTLPELTPRLQALVGLARAAGVIRQEHLSPNPLTKWQSNLTRDLQRFFGFTLPQEGAKFNALIDKNFDQLPDLGKVTDLLGRQLLLEQDPQSAKATGAVFTPIWLARRVLRLALGHWRRLHRSGRLPQTVADLACGPGAFLHALHTDLPGAHRVIGADINPSAISYAKTLSHALGATWELHCQDTLLSQSPVPLLFPDASNSSPSGYDLLIGNPPYVRSQLLPPEYVKQVRTSYASTTEGNFDLSVAFIEHAIERLTEGGIASYILTHKFMSSAYGRAICKRLARDVRVLSVDDFEDYQVFPGYTTYTCVLTFAKIPPSKRFIVTRFPGGVDGLRDPGSGRSTSLPVARLDSHPWQFASHRAHDTLRMLADNRHPLIDSVLGPILQGLRTGSNQVFVVNHETASKLESELLVTFVSGEHIRRSQISPSTLSLIYPYRLSPFGKVAIRPEAELRRDFPKTWSYLLEHRAILEERERDLNCPWYAYSRSQNLEIGSLRKLLVREMMPRAEFAADFNGRLAFASGYAFIASRLSDEDLCLWTAVLCTPTLEFSLRQNGTQLQSGWFRLLKHHLGRVRLPALSPKARSEAVKLSRGFHENPSAVQVLAKLDKVVADAFGLEESHRKVIASVLEDAHARSLRGQPEDSKIKNHAAPKAILRFEPVRLEHYDALHRDRPDLRRGVTFVPNKETPIHRWYKYTQGFSAELVGSLLSDLKVSKSDVVLDPFVGCGTTPLVCRQQGINSIGLEVSPLMVWVARTKTRNWNHRELRRLVSSFSPPAPNACRNRDYESSVFTEYLGKAYAPDILRQLWSISSYIDSLSVSSYCQSFLKLGLLGIMEDVSQIRKHGSHYRFMLRTESIGLQKLNTPIISPNADIRTLLRTRLEEMVADVEKASLRLPLAACDIQAGDARASKIKSGSVNFVITSPPYLNRNNYIAQQKAELAIMSLVESVAQYRELVERTVRSHVEGKFCQGKPSSPFPEVQTIVDALSLTENNNPKIPHMIAAYFDDLAATMRELWRVMKSGGRAAFVVGNSRWGGIVVPVDHLLLKLSEQIGFQPERVLVTRLKGNSPQQMRQYGRIPVRESIIVFKKP